MENANQVQEVQEQSAENILVQKKSFFKTMLSVIRFLVFWGVMGIMILYVLPLDNFSLSTLAHPGMIAVLLLGAIVIGGIFYFLMAPGGLVASAFDLEAVLALVFGFVIMIIAGVVSLSSNENREIVFLALILGSMYMFYIYRIIKETLRLKSENESMQKKYGELLEMDREKSDFITVTSHQLRTPLTEIKWGLEMVLDKEDKLEQFNRSLLEKSLEGVRKLAVIVNDMFKARTFEQMSDFSLKLEVVNVVSMLEEIMRELDLLAQQKQVSINLNFPDRNIEVAADREKLKLAVFNVVDDSIRYSPKGSVAITVGREGKHVQIRIEDTGIGVAPEDYGRLFTKFYRGKNALLVQPDGSGIGLYSARKIIQKHGGSIDFVSTLHKGTIFIIRLPVKQ